MSSLSQNEPFERFADYLLTCFDASELRRLLGYLPEGAQLSRQLPGGDASPVTLAAAAVAALAKLNLLQEPAFWESLRRARPRRIEEINQWQAAFRSYTPAEILPGRASDGPPAPAATTADRTAEPPVPASELEILLVSASPIRGRRLAVDVEFGRVIEKLRHRPNLKIVQRTAVTFDSLQSALIDHRPNVMHISSHGDQDCLHFEPAQYGASTQKVPNAAFLQTLGALGDALRFVVINACHSLTLAQAIVSPPTPVAEWAIGMNAPFVDEDAINFSVALYDAIAGGRSLDAAFRATLARLMVGAPANTAPHQIPQLVPNDPTRARKAVLVASSAPARF